MTLLTDIVHTSAAVADTSARTAKIGYIAELLRQTRPAEAAIAVAYLSGQLRQRQIGVGYAADSDLPSPADAPRSP
jgi:DNA ligase-1